MLDERFLCLACMTTSSQLLLPKQFPFGVNSEMALKKPPKGVYVLLVIWGAMIAYMGYTLFFTDVVEEEREMISSAEKWEVENRGALLAENSASENILINGKIINKGSNGEDYDTSGWYHVIYEGGLYVCEVYVDDEFDDRGEHVWTTCFTSINN